MRKMILPLVALGSLALGGCVAGMAASAVGAAVNSARSQQAAARARLSGQAAAEACTASASQHGQVRIIDVEVRSSSKLVVWGTVETAKGRRSFECSYNGKVSGLKLREIAAR
ncbi:MAG TPA: hypothetical protein VK391_08180 [Allosphingosinicella sp.]|nr:hypothetical protein [Allosphingosinicella sp.]